MKAKIGSMNKKTKTVVPLLPETSVSFLAIALHSLICARSDVSKPVAVEVVEMNRIVCDLSVWLRVWWVPHRDDWHFDSTRDVVISL